MRCADCGLDLLAHTSICPRCGSPVGASAPPPLAAGAPPVSAPSELPSLSASGSSPVAWVPPTGPQGLPHSPTAYQGAAGYQVPPADGFPPPGSAGYPPPRQTAPLAASAPSKRNLLLALGVAVMLVIAGGVVLIQRGSEGNSGAAAPVSSGLAPSSVSVPSTALATPAPTSTATVPASAPTIIDAGDLHACAVTVSGGLTCWGDNTYGQLGDDSSSVPVPVPVGVVGLGSGVRAVTAGGEHSCAVTTGGAVKCWGRNGFGQLGDDTTENQTAPVDVVGLGSGVQAISAGSDHTCALTSEGALKCWGAEPGDYTTGNQTVPVDVVGWSSVSAGLHHTCAMTISGKVECWGANDSGQLGDGTLPVDWSDVDVATDMLAGWYSGVCKGRKVAISAPYKGKSHPLVILGPGSDHNKWAVKLVGEGAPKGLRPTGIENVQLVVCITQKVKSGPACGTYVRSSDHVRGTLRRRKDVVTVRIMVASTGKEIRRNTFTRMPTCPTRTSVGSADPPWYLGTLHVSAKTPLPYIVGFTKGSARR